MKPHSAVWRFSGNAIPLLKVIYPDNASMSLGPVRGQYPMNATSDVKQIADTSALVLLWCGAEIYSSSAVQRYARMLDLRKGERLFSMCNEIWPDYHSVIRLRKICIAQEVKSRLAGGQFRQVIIPGAGFSMLGVELVELFSSVRVFELDTSQMPEKQLIVDNVFNGLDRTLHCLAADVNQPERCRQCLEAAGWQSEEPSLMIIEGLSYYLTKESVRRQWGALAEGSSIIMEYLVPYEQVSAERRRIPKAVFELIMNYCSLSPHVTHWSETELKQEEDVQLDFCHTLSDIERSIGSKRRLFAERHDGWIEIACLSRRKASDVPILLA